MARSKNIVLVLSETVLVIVIEMGPISDQSHGSASSRNPPRSTICIAAVLTAIEYEYRFAEYEYDEIRCDVRILVWP